MASKRTVFLSTQSDAAQDALAPRGGLLGGNSRLRKNVPEAQCLIRGSCADAGAIRALGHVQRPGSMPCQLTHLHCRCIVKSDKLPWFAFEFMRRPPLSRREDQMLSKVPIQNQPTAIVA